MNKLVVTTLESKFHVFDMRTQHPNKGFAGLAEKVNSLDFLFSLSVCDALHWISLSVGCPMVDVRDRHGGCTGRHIDQCTVQCNHVWDYTHFWSMTVFVVRCCAWHAGQPGNSVVVSTPAPEPWHFHDIWRQWESQSLEIVRDWKLEICAKFCDGKKKDIPCLLFSLSLSLSLSLFLFG